MSEGDRKRDGPEGFGPEVWLELLRRAGVVTLPWELASRQGRLGAVPTESLYVWEVLLGRCTAPAAPALAAGTARTPSAADELVWHWPEQNPRYTVSLALPRGREADGRLCFKFSFHHLGGKNDGQPALGLVGQSVLFAGQEEAIRQFKLGAYSAAVAEFLVREKPEGEETLQLAIGGTACGRHPG
jgi:hypothetical protein